MTIGQARRYAQKMLASVGAEHEARYMIQALLDQSWAEVLANDACDLEESQFEKLQLYIKQRLSGNPIQYIMGEWPFMGFKMSVRPGVLIPRDDSEVLVYEAMKFIERQGLKNACDICCGTGCLGIALAKLSGVEVTFSDISDIAVSVTKENILRHGLAPRVAQGNLFSALGYQTDRFFDLIICNPPYIPTKDIDGLDAIVRRHEPKLALDGGADGLDFYRRIALEAPDFMTEKGVLILEIGYDQADTVRQILESTGWRDINIIKDMNECNRAVTAHRPRIC